MTPALVAPWFGEDEAYARMARVLRYSAARWCPGWTVQVEASVPEPLACPSGNPGHLVNTQKMEHWAGVVAAAPEGARLVLTDADMMVTGALDALWALPFDVAYTTKDSHLPFNTGVVAVRVGPGVRRFMEAWRLEQRRMLADPVYHAPYRRKFGGINQAALGRLLSSGGNLGVELRALPCLEWNCEDTSWPRFDPARTRLVHVKSALRRAIFAPTPWSRTLSALVRVWREYERAALEQEVLS